MFSKLGFGSGYTNPEPIKPKNAPVKVDYTSNPIDIPSDFLTSPPAAPITRRPVPFVAGGLPEHANKIAVVLDNVLSPDECTRLLALTESSVPRKDGEPAWQPARVAVAPGWEALSPGYRESDRIIWDQQDVVDRIWDRCLLSEGLKELIATVPWEPKYGETGTGQWELRRLNERMRFLKYSPGQFFKRKLSCHKGLVPTLTCPAHVDSTTWLPTDAAEFRTHYTLHLFLNDSAAESESGEGVVGGSTAFLSFDKKHRLDVNLKAGSVLIFQHKGLLHEGSLVEKGVKYTMRTDIVYELVKDKEAAEDESAKDQVE